MSMVAAEGGKAFFAFRNGWRPLAKRQSNLTSECDVTIVNNPAPLVAWGAWEAPAGGNVQILIDINLSEMLTDYMIR